MICEQLPKIQAGPLPWPREYLEPHLLGKEQCVAMRDACAMCHAVFSFQPFPPFPSLQDLGTTA